MKQQMCNKRLTMEVKVADK